MTLATVALNCAKQIGRANSTGTAIIALEAEIKSEIQEAIRFYNRKPWALTEFRGMILTTVADTTWYSTVDLTSGDGDQSNSGRTAVNVNTILTIDHMRYDDEDISRVSYRELERLVEASDTGGAEPYHFAVYAGQIGLWPTPTSAIEVYLSGTIKAPIPTADGDDSVWLTEAQELIEAAALKRMCTKHLRDNERAAQFEVLERDAMRALVGENMLKTGTGKIRAHC